MKTKYVIYIIIVFVAILTASHIMFQVSLSRADKLHYQNLRNLRDTVTKYETTIKGLRTTVSEKNSVILSQKDAIKSALVEKEQLKKLNIKTLENVTRLQSYIEILRDSVSTDAVIVYVDSAKALRLPFNFADTNKYLSLKGRFDYSGKMSYSLAIPIDLDVYVGMNRKGVTKSVVTTTNPYVQIRDITSVKIDREKESRFGLGLFGGYGVTTKGPAPMVGVGITYSIIKF